MFFSRRAEVIFSMLQQHQSANKVFFSWWAKMISPGCLSSTQLAASHLRKSNWGGDKDNLLLRWDTCCKPASIIYGEIIFALCGIQYHYCVLFRLSYENLSDYVIRGNIQLIFFVENTLHVESHSHRQRQVGGQFGTGQFGTKVVKTNNLAPRRQTDNLAPR